MKEVQPEACPTCLRPFKKLKDEQRARSGVGTGNEKIAAKQLKNTGTACDRIYEYLKIKGDWASGNELRDALGGGDGPRRARQLRDEYAIPIEIKIEDRKGYRKQAWYRLARVEPKTLFDLFAEHDA